MGGGRGVGGGAWVVRTRLNHEHMKTIDVALPINCLVHQNIDFGAVE